MQEYIKIYNWMLDNLTTKNELLVYAIIHSYTENGHGYYGSLSTLATKVKTSKSRICKVISSLVEKGMIQKQIEYKGGEKFCIYKANMNRCP